MSDKAKGILGLFIFIAFIGGWFQSCTHEHDWMDATCTEPRTCSSCKKTEGNPLGHQWVSATCTVPKTCSVCGKTSGKPSKHDWIMPTCETPKTCSVCGAQEGEPYGHKFNIGQVTVKPTCQTPGENTSYCRRNGCDKTEITVIPTIDHKAGDWQVVESASTSAFVIKARYCTMCGEEIDRKQFTLSSSDGGGGGTGGNSNSGGNVGNNFNTYNNESHQNTTATYVLNTSTMKFHRPSCRDVPKISPSNYATSNQSRSSLISSGYSACGHCSP